MKSIWHSQLFRNELHPRRSNAIYYLWLPMTFGCSSRQRTAAAECVCECRSPKRNNSQDGDDHTGYASGFSIPVKPQSSIRPGSAECESPLECGAAWNAFRIGLIQDRSAYQFASAAFRPQVTRTKVQPHLFGRSGFDTLPLERCDRDGQRRRPPRVKSKASPGGFR